MLFTSNTHKIAQLKMIRAKPVLCQKEEWLIEIGHFE
jgi:hypothetical protein